jgi:hypothetical protein
MPADILAGLLGGCLITAGIKTNIYGVQMLGGIFLILRAAYQSMLASPVIPIARVATQFWI